MSTLVFFVEQTAVALYIFVGVGMVWYYRKWLLASYEFRSAGYELGRDYARQRRGAALFAVLLLAEGGLLVLGVQTVVAPTVREDRAVAAVMQPMSQTINNDTAQDGEFATSTPPAVVDLPEFDTSGIELGVDDGFVVFVTPTLTPTPVGTIEPNPPPLIGCDTEYASLQIPANGMRVFQPIRVAGVAYYDDFSQFKLEIAGPETLGEFWVLDSVPFPADQLSTLSQFDPDVYDPGTYQFRLTVFDTTDTLVASCQVNIFISRPEPTPTPLAGS